MSRWVGALAIAAIAALLVMTWHDRKAHEEKGRWQAIAVRLQRDSAQAASQIGRTDSVFFRDTVKVAQTVTRYRTLVDSLRVTDTLTVREQIIVNAADSTIRACSDALGSCRASIAARDSLLRIVGQQRTADQRLFDARLRAANPRLLPFVEGGVDPLNSYSLIARGGAEMRLLGPVRLTAAFQYSAAPQAHSSAFVGARITF